MRLARSPRPSLAPRIVSGRIGGVWKAASAITVLALGLSGCSSPSAHPQAAVASTTTTGTSAGSSAPTSQGVSPGTSVPGSPAAGGAASSTFSRWIFTQPALRQVLPDQTVAHLLANTRVYEIVRKAGAVAVPGAQVVTTVTFASAALLQSALSSGSLPAGTGAIMLDLEAWSATPLSEQQHAAATYLAAETLVHAHGLAFIAAPGADLVKVLDPSGTGPLAPRMLQLGLIGQISAHADVVDIQAQSAERQGATYAAFVKAAAAQARAANPAVTVLAGVSANPSGAPVSASQLAAAMQSVRGVVGGFWMNIPGRGPKCPSCNAANPGVAISAMQAAA